MKTFPIAETSVDGRWAYVRLRAVPTRCPTCGRRDIPQEMIRFAKAEARKLLKKQLQRRKKRLVYSAADEMINSTGFYFYAS